TTRVTRSGGAALGLRATTQSRTICEVCGKMFHSMVSLVNHAKSHATDLCGVCGTHFDSEENLKLHLKTHKNGKKWYC
uniref:C2H2-type domain-containing protein n=1 Tax=Seriola lalandi dorsalis TaxID=1841481 RepID=A0A3B4Y195_SERLL